MYIVDQASSYVYQYTLSTGFDISTTSYSGKSYQANAQISTAASLELLPDGKTLLITSISTIFQYTLATAFDLSTISYSGKSFDASANSSFTIGLNIISSNTLMYLTDYYTKTTYEYSLT